MIPMGLLRHRSFGQSPQDISSLMLSFLPNIPDDLLRMLNEEVRFTD